MREEMLDRYRIERRGQRRQPSPRLVADGKFSVLREKKNCRGSELFGEATTRFSRSEKPYARRTTALPFRITSSETPGTSPRYRCSITST
jgi:hypothetical protein